MNDKEASRILHQMWREKRETRDTLERNMGRLVGAPRERRAAEIAHYTEQLMALGVAIAALGDENVD